MKKIVFICFSISIIILSNFASGFANDYKIYRKPLPSLAFVLDPQTVEDEYSVNILYQIYDTLFKFDEFLALQPNLATSWRVLDDGRKYIIDIKSGIKFHNGKLLTVDDIIYTIERFIKKGGALRYPELQSIKGVDDFIAGKSANITGLLKITDLSFEISLIRPFSTMQMVLATYNLSILPKNANTLIQNPIGTGPYKFKSMENGKILHLIANKDYFGKPPYIDEIIYERSSRTEAIEKFNRGVFHDLQWYYPKPEELTTSYSVIKYLSPAVNVILFNSAASPSNEASFRKAVSLSINKQKLLKECFPDKMPAKGFIPYGLAGYDADFPEDIYNPQIAKKLLQSMPASKTKMELTILRLENHPCHGKFDELIIDDLKKVGLNSKLKYVTYQDFMDNYFRSNSFNAIEFTLTPSYPDALALLNYFKSTSKENFARFKSAKYDELLQKSSSAMDRNERIKLYFEAQKIISASIEAVTVNLYYYSNSVVYQPYIRGVIIPPFSSASTPMRTVYFENK